MSDSCYNAENQLIERNELLAICTLKEREIVGALSSEIVHDMNNLLAAIKGFASITLLDLDKMHPSHDNLVQICSASDRAAELMHRVSAFSCRDPGSSSLTSIKDIIQGIREVAGCVGNELLGFVIPDDVWLLKGDRLKLTVALINLIKGSQVSDSAECCATIVAENLDLKENECIWQESQPGCYVVFTIPLVQPLVNFSEGHLFRGEANDGQNSPADLALTTAFRIARRSGGWISYESTSENSFYVSLYWPAVSKSFSS